MAYPPFKMTGHELPGPNQRLQMGVNTEAQQAFNDSPTGKYLKEEMLAKQGVNEQPNNELSNDVTTTGVQGPDAKKNVDIEVTVNGQKV